MAAVWQQAGRGNFYIKNIAARTFPYSVSNYFVFETFT
jgi:hypothetical protein